MTVNPKKARGLVGSFLFGGVEQSLAELKRKEAERKEARKKEHTTEYTSHDRMRANNINIFLCVREALENHPEFEFWREQGVTPEMIESSILKTCKDEQVFMQEMRYYSFCAARGDFETEKITDHLAHFMGGIRRFSGWTVPSGYVSQEDQEIQTLRIIIEANRKKAEEIKKLKEEVAFSEWYLKYLEKPESEEVQAILAKATEIILRALWEKG